MRRVMAVAFLLAVGLLDHASAQPAWDPPEAVDVLGSRHLWDEGQRSFWPGAPPFHVINGTHYFVTRAMDDGACNIVAWHAVAATIELPDCRNGYLVGGDEESLLICLPNQGAPRLLQWRPEDGTIDDQTLNMTPWAYHQPLLLDPDASWYCGGADNGGESVFVPFWSLHPGEAISQAHFIGQLRNPSMVLDYPYMVTPEEAGALETLTPAATFLPLSANLGPISLVVPGVVACEYEEALATDFRTCHQTHRPLGAGIVVAHNRALALFDLTGGLDELRDIHYAHSPEVDDFTGPGRTLWLSGPETLEVSEESFVVALGDSIRHVHGLTPGIIEEASRPETVLSSGYSPAYAAPVSVDGQTTVPRDHDVSRWTTLPLQPVWTWKAEGDRVAALHVTPGGQSHIITLEGGLEAGQGPSTPYATSGRYVRLDTTGQVIQEATIPVQDWALATGAGIGAEPPPAWAFPIVGFDSSFGVHLVPRPDGLWVLQADGMAIHLGQTRTPPGIEVPPYPQPAEPVAIRIIPPVANASMTDISVDWGDGDTESASTPTSLHFEHTWQDAGPVVVRVTVRMDDGTTASAVRHVEIGEQPPLKLNFMQRAFAPGNQDMTWGVIGIFLVLLGGAAGLLARRIGRSRIAAGLRELTGIREHSHDDPLAGLRELQAWYGTQEDRLLRGRLTEDQFRVLESRGARLLRRISHRILHPLGDVLSPALRARLEGAMVDGFVDQAEVADLRTALRAQRLPAARRKPIEAMLDAWA